jgi:DNA repair protein SbcC/Rad50
LHQKLEQLSQAKIEIEDVAAQLNTAYEQLKIEGDVAGAVSGDNARKLNLNRFVLATRLEEVAYAASRRLYVMSQGRYELRQSADLRDGRVRAAGLDLVVTDAWTGIDNRPVSTLSGGEMFLASLSLALGLADVVQAHAGGIRMESIFIDEGFGTLDGEVLDAAIGVLEKLQQTDRLVGLISHVEELKERIPARLTVLKGPKGSTAKFT